MTNSLATPTPDELRVFETVPDLYLVLSPELRILAASNTYLANTLTRREALVGRHLFDAFPDNPATPEAHAVRNLRASLEQVLATGQPHQMALQHYDVPDPSQPGQFVLRYWQPRNTPVLDAHGALRYIIHSTVNVTEREQARHDLQQSQGREQDALAEAQRLNIELRAANEDLQRTNVDLDNFVYMASHDLKAPITNLEGLVGVLQETLAEQSPATQQALAPLLVMMQDSIARFQRTITRLAQVLQMQQTRGLPSGPVDLLAVVEDVQHDLRPMLQQTQAVVDVDLTACPTVAFSGRNLRSLFYNLLSNALKYRHPDRPPHVRLHCRQEAGYTVLVVQDNGLGLDAQQQTKLFTLFQRLHPHVEGTGMGLYIVKRSLENVGGKIEVASTVGEGSTFLVYFPRS